MSFHIGNVHIKNPYILAPMASVSEMPFRVIAMELGAALAPTELISSKGFLKIDVRFNTLRTTKKEVQVQLFGGDVEVMHMQTLGTRCSHYRYQYGLPVKNDENWFGPALMMDPPRASEMIREMIT